MNKRNSSISKSGNNSANCSYSGKRNYNFSYNNRYYKSYTTRIWHNCSLINKFKVSHSGSYFYSIYKNWLSIKCPSLGIKIGWTK